MLPCVRLRQRQQVLDQPAHPLALAGDVAGGRRAHVLCHGRTLHQQIRIPADRSQRRPELVRRVGDEAALGLERDHQLLVGRLNLVEHPIEALAEEADLVSPLGGGEPSLEVARSGDRVGSLDHGLERPKRAPRDQPAGEEGREQGRNRRNDEEAAETLEVLALDAGRLPGHDETAQAQVGSGPRRRIQPQLRRSWCVRGRQRAAVCSGIEERHGHGWSRALDATGARENIAG